MIIPDINLLLYAVITGFPQHRRAHAWWQDTVNGHTRIGLTYPALFGFLRIATNPRAFATRLTMAEALDQLRSWLGAEPAWIPQPTERHIEVLAELLALPGIHSNLVPDAHLAALAIEHGLTLCSTDGDFARFPGLRWENPLAA